jgi:hypothetical protein
MIRSLFILAMAVLITVCHPVSNRPAGTPAPPLSNREQSMDEQTASPCYFESVEADGLFVFSLSGERVRAQLHGFRILPGKVNAANEFLADRTLRVELRCNVMDPGPPVVLSVLFLAWKDKSGDVWKDLGEELFKLGFAERIIDRR